MPSRKRRSKCLSPQSIHRCRMNANCQRLVSPEPIVFLKPLPIPNLISQFPLPYLTSIRPSPHNHNRRAHHTSHPLRDTHPRPGALKAGHLTRHGHHPRRTRRTHRHPTRRHIIPTRHNYSSRITPGSIVPGRHDHARSIRGKIPRWNTVAGRIVHGRRHVHTATAGACGCRRRGEERAVDVEHGAVVRHVALGDFEGVHAGCDGGGGGPGVWGGGRVG